jgi:hypothetical protein
MSDERGRPALCVLEVEEGIAKGHTELKTE